MKCRGGRAASSRWCYGAHRRAPSEVAESVASLGRGLGREPASPQPAARSSPAAAGAPWTPAPTRCDPPGREYRVLSTVHDRDPRQRLFRSSRVRARARRSLRNVVPRKSSGRSPALAASALRCAISKRHLARERCLRRWWLRKDRPSVTADTGLPPPRPGSAASACASVTSTSASSGQQREARRTLAVGCIRVVHRAPHVHNIRAYV